MTTTITVPDFQYAAQYYPEILEVLIQANRANVSEITDEDEAEPFIQLLRSFALSGHLNAVLLDLVAAEGFLRTARLRSSVKRLLELIHYFLGQASPASADLIMKLSGTVAVSSQVTAAGAQFSTPATVIASAITYEDVDGTTIERTDQLTSVQSYRNDTAAFTDETSDANATGPIVTAAWSTPPEPGDVSYFGHKDVQTGGFGTTVSGGASDITSAFEYYSGHTHAKSPDTVTNLGPNLRFTLNDLLVLTPTAQLLTGAGDEWSGGTVRVKCNATGAIEDLTVQWDGSNNYIDTTGFLGQTSPSTVAGDYTVSADWLPLPLSGIIAGASLSLDLPEDLTHQWLSVAVNGVVAYYIRLRVMSVGATPTPMTYDRALWDVGDLYVKTVVTQGESRIADPWESSTGLPDQEYTLPSYPVIDDETLKIFVDEGAGADEWFKQLNFLASSSVDKHFTIWFDDDGQGIPKFGNGTNGKVPAAGVDNLTSTFRTMEEVDGNVGANAIVQNQSGSALIASVWNPRPATGYQPREGSTDEDLAEAKVAGPAALRAGATAASPSEIATFATQFKNAAGATPFTRALAIEESFGPKTIEVVVVGAGGFGALASDLAELELYFNGSPADKVYGVLVTNHQVTASSFTPKAIAVTATVYGGNQTSVETALAALLQPEAKDANGDWVWDYGEEVPLSVIIAEIMGSSPKPRKTVVTVPSADVPLTAKELPIQGALSIMVVS